MGFLDKGLTGLHRRVRLGESDIYKCNNKRFLDGHIRVCLPTVAYDDSTLHPYLCSVKIPYYGTCLYTALGKVMLGKGEKIFNPMKISPDNP